MKIEFSELAPGQEPTVAIDEVAVVLGPKQKEQPAWLAKWLRQSYGSLKRRFHYAHILRGFLGEQGAQPYYIVDWQTGQGSSLEQRWVLGALARQLASEKPATKLVVILLPGSGALERAMAEDLVSQRAGPLYEDCRWNSARLEACDGAAVQAADPHAEIRWSHQWAYRQWLNENPDDCTSIALGDRLESFCKQHKCGFQAIERDELIRLGMNLLVAVGQGSDRSPSRLLIATHNLRDGVAPLLLVGKGVTFDTGGINVKPHESFVNCMKNDMGGAALMIQLFEALVESGCEQPLVLAVPACENLVAQKSMKPGAVIKSYRGPKVIVEHTDAEGRLILADGIAYTQDQFQPALTITAATLTTAALRQFTNFYTPVHFANESMQAAINQAGVNWGESFTHWDSFLPFRMGNNNKAADLTNMGRMPAASAMGGGSNVAAHFLKAFSTGPLVHFDIFATAWNWSGDYPGAHYGATGAPFNSLFSVLSCSEGLWGVAAGPKSSS